MPKSWKERLEQVPIEGVETPSLNPYEASIMAAEFSDTRHDVPFIDLHGLTVADALRDLDAFFHHELNSGTSVVRVIHGIGEGKLSRAVREWLREQQASHNLIASYRASTRPGERGSVILVALETLQSQ